VILEIQVLAWDRHNNVVELNLLMGSPLLIPGSPTVLVLCVLNAILHIFQFYGGSQLYLID
jgi:hypothetical protein